MIETSQIYGLEDNPPLHVAVFLGLQHYLSMISAVVSIPFILTDAVCMSENDPAQSFIFSSMIFVSAIMSFVQVTVGCRLPVVNGVSIALLVPSLAILSQPQWQCPSKAELNAMNEYERTLLWQSRMRELSGAVIICGLLQMFLGYLGIIGTITRFISPLTISTTVTLVGLSLIKNAAGYASKHWGLAVLTIALIVIFSQCLPEWKMPCLKYDKKTGWKMGYFQIFKLFPVLLAVLIVWGVAAILTAIDFFPEASAARTDYRINLMNKSPWFRIPYPGQFGWPTFSLSSTIGLLAGTITIVVEAVGYYSTIALIIGAPPPPRHAVNRGIGTEGVGTILAGLWCCGNGCNTFGENVGVIGITKIGSRRVIQLVCLLMLLQSIFNKFGAVFLIIPEPIMGGIFCVMFGMIAAYGLSTLQFVDLNSPRNLFILGFSLFFSLALPQWMSSNVGVIKTGSSQLDEVLSILLSTNIIVGGVLSCLMDNLLSGSDEERGIISWNNKMTSKPTGENAVDGDVYQAYDFPAGMSLIKRWKWCSYIPFLPSYNPKKLRK